jgi:TRAP-type C4-dicarboxylate transport system substrate-binding protein
MRGFGLCAATAIAALISGPAAAQEFRMASGYPTTSPAYKATEAFVRHLTANSGMTVQVHHSGSLLSFNEIPAGLRDGVADIGVILPPYYPSEFPESNLAANMSMLMTNGTPVKAPGAAMAGVMADYIFNCADCQKGYTSKNVVYLGSLSSSTFDMLCRGSAVRSVDDLKGRKVRVGAANFGRFVEFYGGVQVAIPANEMYEAIAQGVADCVANSVSDLTGFQMADVVNFAMLDIPGGVYSGVDPQNFNRDTWASLSVEQRTAVLRAAAAGSAAATTEYYLDAQRNIESGPGKGVEIIPASEAIRAATAAFVAADLPVVRDQFINQFGVQNVDAKMAEITALIEKWKGIIAGWDGTEDGLAKIYWDEVFSKVDVSTYGLN